MAVGKARAASSESCKRFIYSRKSSTQYLESLVYSVFDASGWTSIVIKAGIAISGSCKRFIFYQVFPLLQPRLDWSPHFFITSFFTGL